MVKQQQQRYEVFMKVREFGARHQDRFPAASPAGRAFATVAEAVATIEHQASDRLVKAHAGRQARAEARKALWDRLKAVVRAARGVTIGRKVNVPDPFRLPERRSDAAIAEASGKFIDAAEVLNGRWAEFGLPDTTLADLRDARAAFLEAVKSRREGRAGVGTARKALNDAFEYGFAAVRHLDIIVANSHEPDSAIADEWKLARREGPASHRAKKDDAPATPATTATAPAADASAPVAPGTGGDTIRRVS